LVEPEPPSSSLPPQADAVSNAATPTTATAALFPQRMVISHRDIDIDVT
jgi:hypothetical protein